MCVVGKFHSNLLSFVVKYIYKETTRIFASREAGFWCGILTDRQAQSRTPKN